EDGIRDFHVTGVQTCALPISQLAAERTDAAITLINRAIADIRNYIGGLTPRQVRRDALAQGLTLAFGDLRAGRPATLELQIDDEIGRASCRERVDVSWVAVAG